MTDKRLVEHMRIAMQAYVDEIQGCVKCPIEGMASQVTPEQMLEVFNDFLLYTNDGVALDRPVVWDSSHPSSEAENA